MWRGTIFAFASTLCMMVFEEGENAHFTFKVVGGDQMLQVNTCAAFLLHRPSFFTARQVEQIFQQPDSEMKAVPQIG